MTTNSRSRTCLRLGWLPATALVAFALALPGCGGFRPLHAGETNPITIPDLGELPGPTPSPTPDDEPTPIPDDLPEPIIVREIVVDWGGGDGGTDPVQVAADAGSPSGFVIVLDEIEVEQTRDTYPGGEVSFAWQGLKPSWLHTPKAFQWDGKRKEIFISTEAPSWASGTSFNLVLVMAVKGKSFDVPVSFTITPHPPVMEADFNFIEGPRFWTGHDHLFWMDWHEGEVTPWQEVTVEWLAGSPTDLTLQVLGLPDAITLEFHEDNDLFTFGHESESRTLKWRLKLTQDFFHWLGKITIQVSNGHQTEALERDLFVGL